jgi:hypothetical protein
MVLATASPSSGLSNYSGDTYYDDINLSVKLAIGLGVPLFATIVGIFIYICCRRRKRRVAKEAEIDGSTVDGFLQKPLPIHPSGSAQSAKEGTTEAVETSRQMSFYAPNNFPSNNSGPPVHIQQVQLSGPIMPPNPVALAGGKDEVDSLRRDQERIRARKTRLLELNRLEEQDWRIEQAISRQSLDASQSATVSGQVKVPPVPSLPPRNAVNNSMMAKGIGQSETVYQEAIAEKPPAISPAISPIETRSSVPKATTK